MQIASIYVSSLLSNEKQKKAGRQQVILQLLFWETWF